MKVAVLSHNKNVWYHKVLNNTSYFHLSKMEMSFQIGQAIISKPSVLRLEEKDSKLSKTCMYAISESWLNY